MAPDMVLFAIRSAMRLTRAASLELEAAIRSRDTQMPSVIRVDAEPIAVLREAVGNATLSDGDRASINAAFRAYGQDHRREAEVWACARQVGLSVEIEHAEDIRGLVTIKQWGEDAKKNKPLARVGLALVEVALDYAGANPAIFGVGSNGERFVRALAGAIDEILPNSDAEGVIAAESLFAERSIAILTHAGLGALQEHVEDNVGEKHLRDISLSVLKPLADNFRENRIHRKTLHDFQDLLLGPMAHEALKAVARNRQAFLGERFADHESLGAVTDEILKVLAAPRADGSSWNIADNVIERDVWVRVYGATVDLAIRRPELLAGSSDNARGKFGRELVRNVATNLKEMTPPLSASVAVTVAADAIGVLGRHTSILFDAAGAWADVAGNATGLVLASVAAGMKAGLVEEKAGAIVIKTEEILSRVFSEEQIGALIRTVLDQAAKNPAMIVGRSQRDEVKALVAGIARSVSDANRNLLSAEDWLQVAALVAEEAAKNPGRLFKMVDNAGKAVDPGDELAVRLTTRLLTAAAADFRARGRDKGSVLFGETLREAIGESIRTASENAAAAATNEDALVALAERINKLQGQNASAFGRNTWLRIFRHYLKTALLTQNGMAAVDAIKDADLLKLVNA